MTFPLTHLPALPRPPLPNAAAIRAMFEAEIAAQCARIGSRKIPYDRNPPGVPNEDLPDDFDPNNP